MELFLYVAVLTAAYLCFVKIAKSYKIPVIFIIPLCFLPFFANVLVLRPLLSVFFVLIALWFYLLSKAKGLKYNQDKHFYFISALLFAAALAILSLP